MKLFTIVPLLVALIAESVWGQSNGMSLNARSRGSLDQGFDACPGLTIAAVPYTDSGTTAGRTNNYSGSCAGGGARDVIYNFTPATTQQYRVSLCGSSFNTALYLRTGGVCPGSTEVVCNDDYCGIQSEVTALLSAGTTYYLVVDGSGTATGSYVLNVSAVTLLPGDNCNSVVMIDSLPFGELGTTADMVDDFHADSNSSPDVIYSFVASDTGFYLISLAGSAFNTLLEVRTGGVCPGDSLVELNDDGVYNDSTGEYDPQSELVVELNGGTQYYVIVDGAGAGNSGTYAIGIMPPYNGGGLPPPVPPHRFCCQPVDLVFVMDRYIAKQRLGYWKWALKSIFQWAEDLSGGTCGDPPDLQVGVVTVSNLVSGHPVTVACQLGSPATALGQLSTVSAPLQQLCWPGTSGAGWDEALLEIYNGQSQGVTGSHFTPGNWRDCALKLVVLVTPNLPSGLDVCYSPADASAAIANAGLLASRGIFVSPIIYYPQNSTLVATATSVANVSGGIAFIEPSPPACNPPPCSWPCALCQTLSRMSWHASSYYELFRRRGQDGLALCSETEMYCVPGVGPQPWPYSIDVIVDNPTNTTCTGGQITLVGSGGTGASGISITPASVPISPPLAPGDQMVATFSINGTLNPNGSTPGQPRLFTASISGNSCPNHDLKYVCLDIPPCAGQCCYCFKNTNNQFVSACQDLTSQACGVLNGHWDVTKTCADGCDHHSRITMIATVPPLTCQNGAILPSPLPVDIDLSSPDGCRRTVCQLLVTGGTGAQATVQNPAWTILTLPSNPPASNSFNLQLGAVNPSGGCVNLRLIVDPDSCCDDTFDICVQIPPCPQVCPDPVLDTEPANDNYSSADIVQCGATYCSEVDPAGDEDWYQIVLPAGQCTKLTVDVQRFPFVFGALDPKLVIYHANGTNVAMFNDDISPTNPDCHAEVCLNAGTYFIKVKGTTPSQNGEYLMSITCPNCPCEPPCPPTPCLSPADLTGGMQGWWPLDETVVGSGHIVEDVIGGIDLHAATGIGGTHEPIVVPGKDCTGRDFTFPSGGTPPNDFVWYETSGLTNTTVGTAGVNEFTVCAWIWTGLMRETGQPDYGEPRPIVSQEAFPPGAPIGASSGFQLFFCNGTPRARIAGRDQNGQYQAMRVPENCIGPAQLPNVPQWYFVAMRYKWQVAPSSLCPLSNSVVLDVWACDPSTGIVYSDAACRQFNGPLDITQADVLRIGYHNLGGLGVNPGQNDGTWEFFFNGFYGKIDEVMFFTWRLLDSDLQNICDRGICKWYVLPITYPGPGNTMNFWMLFANLSTTQNYTWTISGITPTPPGGYGAPIGFSPNSGAIPSIGAGTGGVSVPIVVTLPPGISNAEQTCFKVELVASTGCPGPICFEQCLPGINPPQWLLPPNETFPLLAPVGRDSSFGAWLVNTGSVDDSFNYIIVADPISDTLTGPLMINGQEPGVAAAGSAALAAGDSLWVPFSLQFAEATGFRLYGLSFGADGDHDGQMEYATRIAVGALPIPPAPSQVATLVIGRDSNDVLRLTWYPVAGATRYNVYSSPTPDAAPSSWTRVGTTSEFGWPIDELMPAIARQFFFVTAEN